MMSKKMWWIAGGLAGAGVIAVLASAMAVRTRAPQDMQDAAEETAGVAAAFAYRESDLLCLSKVAGVNLVVTATDRESAETTIREVFANVEQAMLAHGYDELTVTARSEDGGIVLEATNAGGPLSVVELPVDAAQALGLTELPVEVLDEHLEHVVLER